MPAALSDLVAVAALVTMLAVAFWHPRGRTEALLGLAVAAGVLLLGVGDPAQARHQVAEMFPVVAFLVAILVVGEACAAEGLFTAVGSRLARAGRHHAQRLLALAFLVAAFVTAVLSLDATVVLLTPVVAAAATAAGTSARPLRHACVRLANSASLLLPVSNLTNLLALPAVSLTFLQWGAVMAPVWCVVLLVEYAAHRAYFAKDLLVDRVDQAAGARADTDPAATGTDSRRATTGPPDDRAQRITPPATFAPETEQGALLPAGAPALPRVPLVVVSLMLIGFAAGSAAGVAPAWSAAGAAVVLVAHASSRGRMSLRSAAQAAHPTFAVFVLALAVVVAALEDTFLGDLVSALVPTGDSLAAMLGMAALASVLANVVNNLPATLLLVPVAAPLGLPAVLAALIGLNVGAGLTYTGSLANLLWRRVLVRAGARPSAREFHLFALAVTPVAVVASVCALWLSLRVVPGLP